ncbi:unnamed protein product [Chironomus riparius]|uniref:Uncharacterized protein n=1 Tax=Chironomus riparius TaxID=315576 RepID=A0A9N9S4U3_9DIPT|nr:unnamed protein product [Chironomus riparius]
MGIIFSFCFKWMHDCISDGQLTVSEATALINRQAYRMHLKRHVENMPNVRNVEELVEQLLNEMPPNFFEPEQPSKIFYIQSPSST